MSLLSFTSQIIQLLHLTSNTNLTVSLGPYWALCAVFVCDTYSTLCKTRCTCSAQYRICFVSQQKCVPSTKSTYKARKRYVDKLLLVTQFKGKSYHFNKFGINARLQRSEYYVMSTKAVLYAFTKP